MAAARRLSTNIMPRRLLVFAVAVAAALLAHGAAVAGSAPSYHPSIAAWVDDHPNEPVPLIVQHDGSADDLLSFVADAGGAVEREFHIIPALDIDLPADDLDELAGHQDVTWVSLDAPIVSTANDEDSLSTVYPTAVNAPQAWQDATGSGVTVALIDTGTSDDAKEDFQNSSGSLRIAWETPDPDLDADEDGFGHGTHVAGIIAGRSTKTNPAGKYTGIAPGANLLSVRIADDEGNATVGDLMAGLEFVDDHRHDYNIRVLNLSVTSSVAQSYKVDPIDAAVELLWFHGIVVVVAAGNDGDASDAVHYPPANDPFVITVGAFDDQGTADQNDDALASWSSRGQTQDGFAKPEVVAPGAGIVAPVGPSSYLVEHYPEAVVDDSDNALYFQMSGSSMATGVVSGVAALILEEHPNWTPGEVKTALMETARSVSGGAKGVRADAAVNRNGRPASADDGISPSYMLLAAVVSDQLDANSGGLLGGLLSTTDPVVVAVGDALDPDDAAVFDGIRWRDAKFQGIRWRGLEFEGIRWRQVDWSGIRWRHVEFEGIRWRGSTEYESMRWQGIRWRSFVEEN